LRGLLWLVVGALYLLTAVYTFVAMASVMAAPFNDLLAERTERILRGEAADTPLNWKTIMAEARYTIKHEALKALVLLLCLLALFLINFIPIAGSVAYAVLNPLVTLGFITLNFTDVIMSRRKLGLREKFRVVMRHPGSSLGFGAAAFAALVVPGLNVLMLGGAVVGATQMYLEQWELPVPRPEEPPAHVA
jgi:CysZ protein